MSKKTDKPAHSPADAAAARERQRLIGRRLQSFFDDTIQQGVPDEFEALLSKLDEAEAGRSGSTTADETPGETEEAQRKNGAGSVR